MTVVSLDYLDELVKTKQQQLDSLATQIAETEKQSAEAQAKAGWQLVAHESGWNSAERTPRIEAARGLGQLVYSLEQQVAEVKARPHHGVGGVFRRLTDSREIDTLTGKLESARAELDNRYRAVADGLEPPTGVGDADQMIAKVRELDANARALKATRDLAMQEIGRLKAEVDRRKDVVKEVGFDALGIQADLELNGIRPIATSMVLKSKEVAAYQVSATLCRYATRTQYVGGSHGVSIPLGHGFRYRVSSYRGHPVQSQYLARVDQGTLVVTNQRLAFLGTKKDVSAPIAKLIHLEPYSDAVGIGREGKESRDVYLVPRPAQLLLYIQWVINHQA